MSAAEERRRHTREPLDHAALLEHADWGARACRLRDVSVGGALVVSNGSGLEAGRCNPGDVVQMRFNGQPGVRDSSDTHVVSGRVVRVLRGALGISFVDATARALGVLRRLVEAHRHEHAGGIDRGAALTRVAQSIAAFQREQGPVFLRHLENALMEAAREANNDRDSRVLFDARRSLESQRASFLARLQGDLDRQMAERAAGDPADPATPAAANDSGGFSLVDLSAFEDMLVAQQCLERAERSDPRLFHRYRRGLEALPPPPPGLRDPLDPESILTRFAEAAHGLGLDAATRPVLASAFGEALEEPLRRLLAALIEVMPAVSPLATPNAPRPQAERPGWGRAQGSGLRASDFGDHGPLDAVAAPASRSVPAPASTAHGAADSPARSPATGAPTSAFGGPAMARNGASATMASEAPAGAASALHPSAGGGAGGWPWSTAAAGRPVNHFQPGAVPLAGTLSGSLPPFDFPRLPALAPVALAGRLLARQPGASRLISRQAAPADWQRWFAAFATQMAAEANGVPAGERSHGLLQRLRVERADLAAEPPVGELHEALELADAHWEALASDPFVHPEVLGALSRVRAWMHAWGLREPRWMLRDTAPLGLLLDRLCALWPRAGAEAGVVELVEAVCHRLLDDADQALADPVLMETLEGALQVQRERARERIEALIRENDEAWANTLARRRRSGEPTPRLDETASPLRHWLRLARDWRRGDRALLQRGRRRLPVELVWMDDEATAWVFADPAGQDVAAMTRQEFAVHLRRGSLARSERAREPLSLRLRRVLLEQLAGKVTRPPEDASREPAEDPTLRLSEAELAGGVNGDRTLRLGAGVGAGATHTWREADGRILESGVLPLSGERALHGVAATTGQAERFVEVVAVGSGNVAEPVRLPELAPALDKAGVRQRLDLALWDNALATAEASGAGECGWAVRLAAATLLAADGFEAFQSRLLEAAVPPRRITLVVDAGTGDAPPEGLAEVLHALDGLGLRVAVDASRCSLTGWRNLPITRVWVRAPAAGAAQAECERIASLADFARWAEWPLVAIVDAGSMPAADLASLGVTHLAAPREWRPLPTLQ